ncbi:MAG: AI-2E family transporter [Egibacteraceae bacterium]
MAARSTDGLRRAAYRVWIAVGATALAYVAYRVLAEPLAVIVPPLLLALIVTYLLNPLVSGLERKGWSRLAATALGYMGLLLAVGLFLTLLAPLLVAQFSAFAAEAPRLGSELARSVTNVARSIGVNLPGDKLTAEAIGEQVQQVFGDERSLTTLLALLGGISGVATGALHLVVIFVLGPVIAFYLLVDLPRLRDWSARLVPPSYRGEVRTVGEQLSGVVGGYVRGQLLVALFVGVASSLGLGLVGLSFWLVVGLLAGVTNLIPLLGPLVAGLIGVTIALLTEGPAQALLVVLVMVVVQQLDNHIVSPLVMGRTVRLHPLIVLLALVVGGSLYGIFGLIVAVPGVAAVNVLAGHTWQTRVPWSGDDTPEDASSLQELTLEPRTADADR